MRLSVKKSGLVFAKDIPSDLKEDPCFNSLRGTDLIYTGWRWIPYLKSKVKLELADPESKDNLKYLSDKHRSAGIFDNGNLDWKIRNEYFKFPLWDHQVHAAMLMMQQKRFYVSLDVGDGKTLATIAALLKLKEKRLINRALVLCPASIIYQWKDEIHSSLKPEYADSVSVQVIRGTPKERREQWGNDVFIYLMTYESFRKDFSEFGFSPVIQKVQALVLDEAWKIKSHTTELNKALKKAIPYSLDYRFALNATPIKNRYLDLFGVYSIIDPFLFVSFKNFSSRYMVFVSTYIRKLKRKIPLAKGYKNVSEIYKLCYPSLFMPGNVEKSKDRPKLTISPYWVELSPSQRRAYTDITKLPQMNPLEKCTRARVQCMGADDIKNSSKFEMLKEIITEIIPDKKIVIFCESLMFLQAAQKELSVTNNRALLISGKDSSSDRESKVNMFRDKERLLMMTRAGEAGLNLQCADILINMDLPWSPASLKQRVGRLRPNLGTSERTIHILNILARDTIEERMIKIIQEKRTSIAQLFSTKEDDLVGEFNPRQLEALL